jgi:hypothetical protein
MEAHGHAATNASDRAKPALMLADRVAGSD